MYARVTELAGFGDRLDEYLERVRGRVLSELRLATGYAGYLNLVDRDGDRVLVVSIWETREQMRATEGLVHRLRRGAATAVGAEARWVREYELAVSEAWSPSLPGGIAGARPRTARRRPPRRR